MHILIENFNKETLRHIIPLNEVTFCRFLSGIQTMERCHYKTIDSVTSEQKVIVKIPRKHLLRQIYVSSGIWSIYFSLGLGFGSPTVIIPQLRREANSTDAVSIEMVSWLSSTYNHSGLVSVIILSVLSRQIGRKFTFLFVCITSLIGFILFYCGTTPVHILISEVIHGPLAAAPTTISIMVLSEYTSPRYRGVLLTIKSATYVWGVWVSNTIGTYFHWKNIGIVGFICSTYSLLTMLHWPESPYWLGSQNRLEKCTESHRWLKGVNEESERELEALIESRKDLNTCRSKNHFKKLFVMLTSKSFYKPILLSMLVLLLYICSGKFTCAMFAIDIVKQMTKEESSAYTGMLILDGITIVGMYVGCGFSKILKRRTLLLSSATIGTVFLFLISLYLYLKKMEIISENTIISILLLMGYSLAISVGPMIMATTLLGELIPVKYRSSATLILGCFANLSLGAVLKISPFVLHYFGSIGLFIFFALSTLICIILIYYVMPETKDKTLLEIQEIMFK